MVIRIWARHFRLSILGKFRFAGPKLCSRSDSMSPTRTKREGLDAHLKRLKGLPYSLRAWVGMTPINEKHK